MLSWLLLNTKNGPKKHNKLFFCPRPKLSTGARSRPAQWAVSSRFIESTNLTISTISPFTPRYYLITSFKTGHPGERKQGSLLYPKSDNSDLSQFPSCRLMLQRLPGRSKKIIFIYGKNYNLKIRLRSRSCIYIIQIFLLQ